MATYTEHYGLHQWEATDNFLRTDFNTDHQLIDAALAELDDNKGAWVYGTYTGNGTRTQYEEDAPYQTISLSFQPKAVIVSMPRFTFGGTNWNNWNTVTMVRGVQVYGTESSYHTKAQITEDGFQVNTYLNSDGTQYCYLALK